MTDELCYLTATEALAAFEQKTLAPSELMGALIERAEATEPNINAICIDYFDEAMSQAKVADGIYANRGRERRPLEGLAVAVKEETDVQGQRTTLGSLIHKNNVATESSVVAERILEAGGIVHARTTAPEYSSAPFTHSRLWGVTRNPWNPDFSPGGSSGGAAATLAVGSTTLATGSDIGGSIRLPASACGVVGFKPPYGRVPEFPPFNLDTYCHEGPMARTVLDCALLENVLAGPHPSDVVSLRPKLVLPDQFDSIAGMRIAVCVTLGDYEVDADVADNTLAAADVLRAAGASVDEVSLPWNRKQIREAALIHFAAIFAPGIRESISRHRDQMTTYAIDLAERLVLGPDDVMRGLQLESEIYAPLGRLLDDYDLLVCPTQALPAFDAGSDYVGFGPVVNGVALDDVWEAMMTLPFNIASRCPVLNVPSGIASNGVPTGIQIVGRTYDDVSVFAAGAAFEREQPWLDHPARRPAVGEPAGN